MFSCLYIKKKKKKQQTVEAAKRMEVLQGHHIPTYKATILKDGLEKKNSH